MAFTPAMATDRWGIRHRQDRPRSPLAARLCMTYRWIPIATGYTGGGISTPQPCHRYLFACAHTFSRWRVCGHYRLSTSAQLRRAIATPITIDQLSLTDLL